MKGKVCVPGKYVPETYGLLAPWREMQYRRTKMWVARVQGLVQGPGAGPSAAQHENGICSITKK